MNRNNWAELVKLSTAIIVAAFLWHQVTELRKARGAEIENVTIEPRWVIQLTVTENDVPVELIEFIFASYEGCWRAARDVMIALDIDFFPSCLLLWVDPGEDGQLP